MPSSPLSERSVCHSPSPSVTPQSAAATQSPLMHLSIPATMARRSLTWSPLQKEDMSSYSPYMVLKRPRSPPPRALYSSSGHRSAEPSPPFIYHLIHLPVLAPFYLTLRLYHLSVCSRRIPRWLLFAINMLCSSLLRK